MSKTPSGAAFSGLPPIHPADIREFIVKRDKERPYSFAGVCLAKQQITSMLSETVQAAVYRTVGGKIIATLSKDSPLDRLSAGLQIKTVLDELTVNESIGTKPKSDVYHKAEVFDSLEDAIGWFKPGRLTDALRKELGLDDPIRID